MAHEQGIIHGDVKPENIVLLPDDRLKLLDFGVARCLAAELVTSTQNHTISGWLSPSQLAGTLAYIAPEQITNTTATDHRCDLFSMGTVLFEVAAGQRPFPSSNPTALVAQILNTPPPCLRDMVPNLPEEFARIVHKLLEKRPESRYQSAREVRVDLVNLARDLDFGKNIPGSVLGKRSVAVLPFKLLTPNSEYEYLSLALADSVTTELSATGELLVRPTSTVMRYARQAADAMSAATELNVHIIIEGSIQKHDTHLRVHVQAWDRTQGSSLLSAKYDSEMADLFGLQDQIARAVAKALSLSHPKEPQSPAEPPTNNPMAYELFLRSGERLFKLNRWDMITAIEMLQSAVELDSHFAEAWARLASAYVQMGVTFEPGRIWMQRAERAVKRALAIDRENADAEYARGRILWTPARRFQNKSALQALLRALRKNPGHHQAQIWRGMILFHIGLHEDARQALLAALAAQPDDPFTLVFLGQVAMYCLRYDEAIDYHSRALALDPSHLWGNIFTPTIYLYSGNLEMAERKIKAAKGLLPKDSWLLSCEALLMAKRGEKKKAEQLVNRALAGELPLLHTHHMWHTIAATNALLQKPAPAVALLKKASSLGLPNYPLFRDDPHFESLHSYRPYLSLMSKLQRQWIEHAREFGTTSTSARANAAN